MSKFYNYKKSELDDDSIIEALKKLPEMYENGELLEVADECCEIYRAILEYEADAD